MLGILNLDSLSVDQLKDSPIAQIFLHVRTVNFTYYVSEKVVV